MTQRGGPVRKFKHQNFFSLSLKSSEVVESMVASDWLYLSLYHARVQWLIKPLSQHGLLRARLTGGHSVILHFIGLEPQTARFTGSNHSANVVCATCAICGS